jgi:transposase
MSQVTTIGLDIAKSIFQVHGVDAAGRSVLRQRLSRRRVLEFFGKLPRSLVGLEACASSHYWARELMALGHEVKLMPAQYVKPYVKRGKNDVADAEAICEAVTRPTMRFVAVKTPEQEACDREIGRINATSALQLGYIPIVLSGAAPAIRTLFQDGVVWDVFIAVARQLPHRVAAE